MKFNVSEDTIIRWTYENLDRVCRDFRGYAYSKNRFIKDRLLFHLTRPNLFDSPYINITTRDYFHDFDFWIGTDSYTLSELVERTGEMNRYVNICDFFRSDTFSDLYPDLLSMSVLNS